MTAEEWVEGLRPWLRAEQQPMFAAAWGWLAPRCRTEEERQLAPALLLLLAPLNALVTPCRPSAGSCVNFQVTLSRPGIAGPDRVRLTVRAGPSVQAFGHSGVRSDPSDPSDPPDLSEPSAPTPEHLNTRTPEHLTLWLDASALAEDPLGSATSVLVALLERGSKTLGRKPSPGA